MKNILLITESFPPLNSIGSGRPYSWAYYLSKFGYDITVLTTKKTEQDGKLNYIKDTSSFNFIELDVLSNRFKLFDFIRKSLKVIKDIKFDVVISTSNPWQTHYIAKTYKKTYSNTKWIADFRDLWSLNHYYKDNIKRKIHKVLEKNIIKYADILTTVSEPLREELEKFHNIKSYTIYNGFEITQNPKEKQNLKLTISYLGTIYPQREEALLVFLESIKELINNKQIVLNQIEINFYGNRLGNLPNIIENDNLYKRFVNIFGLVSREESLKIQNESDLLLLLEWKDAKTKGILTGKLFEYLASGTPIISVGQDDSFSASEVIKRCNVGFICGNDKNKIKNVILMLLNKEYKYNPNYEEINRFSRENQSKKLLNIIEGIIS